MTVVEEKTKFKDFSLSVKDMKFLSSKMGINPNKAKNLFEQKQDLDLILFQISSNKVLVRDFSGLSFYPFSLDRAYQGHPVYIWSLLVVAFSPP